MREEEPDRSLTLVYCYAPEDQTWRDKIDLRLREVKRHCHIMNVVDSFLLWDEQQDRRPFADLEDHDLVLLLVSTHFQAAGAVPLLDLRTRLEVLRWTGGCFVIALLLEEVAWDGAPFGSRIILPSDGRPVSTWQDQEQALHEIEKGISAAIEQLWLTRGHWFSFEMQNGKTALVAYEEALRLNPTNKWGWYGKGNALLEWAEDEEQTAHSTEELYQMALDAYDQALQIDPTFSWAWYCRGNAFASLKRYEEALGAYDEALRFDPAYIHAWYWKGEALKALGRRREARQAKKKARQLGWPF
jgi:tetratricopeptide (TPR) repeat protein